MSNILMLIFLCSCIELSWFFKTTTSSTIDVADTCPATEPFMKHCVREIGKARVFPRMQKGARVPANIWAGNWEYYNALLWRRGEQCVEEGKGM